MKTQVCHKTIKAEDGKLGFASAFFKTVAARQSAPACQAEKLLKEAEVCSKSNSANHGQGLLARLYLMPTVAPCCRSVVGGMEAMADRNRLIRVNMFRIACSSLALASWEFNSSTASGVFVLMARLHFALKQWMLRDLSHPAASNFSNNFWCPLIAGSRPRSIVWGKSIDCRTCSAVARFTNSPLASMPSKMYSTEFFGATSST